MKKVALLFIAVAVFFGGNVKSFAQQIEMSSSLNPVGSGARATGMGGAFIGVADDATAASWNPAGLVQLEKPEVSVVYAYFNRRQAYSSWSHPEMESENSMDANGLNYASVAYPFVLLNRNMIVSLNYQRLFEMNKAFDFKYTWYNAGIKRYDNIECYQEGFLYAVSPAYAVQVTPEFYLGATLNLWGDYLGKNGWSNEYKSFNKKTIAGFHITEKDVWKNTLSFEGTNANFGFLWNVYGPFTVGGVFKTPFEAKLRQEGSVYNRTDWPVLKELSKKTFEDLTMEMPASYGLGLSYRHSDALMVAFDIYRTEWSRFLLRDSKGREKNPVYGDSLSKGRLSDTTQLRLGTEYLFIGEKRVIPVRAGLFYDPEPMRGNFDDYYGFSFGTGYSTGKFSVDASYQYRFGRNVSGDMANIEGTSVDINQHTVMMSLIYYF